jgi:uncharacterized membrane protein
MSVPDTTPRQTGRITDYAVEQLVGRVLQIGVVLSGALLVVGGSMLVAIHGHEVPAYTPFRGEPEQIRTLSGIVHGAVALDSRSIIQLGLVLLIATPIVRVALTLVAFILQRDRIYVYITALVLALLLYGLIFGRA